MADPTNVDLWTDADVYVGDNTVTAGPTDVTTAWGAGWSAVGLLDGEEGITESREEETGEHYAWGGLLVATTRSKQKRTVKFAMLEDNAVTFGIVNPGSTRTTTAGVTSETIKVPKHKKFPVGFEVRDGDSVKRRWAKKAEVVKIEDVKESEEDPTAYVVTVVIYPEADGTLWKTVKGAAA